jgi:hypothetical protein
MADKENLRLQMDWYLVGLGYSLNFIKILLLHLLILPSFFLPTNVVYFVLVLADWIFSGKRTKTSRSQYGIGVKFCLSASSKSAVNK